MNINWNRIEGTVTIPGTTNSKKIIMQVVKLKSACAACKEKQTGNVQVTGNAGETFVVTLTGICGDKKCNGKVLATASGKLKK